MTKLRSPIFHLHESAGARLLDWGGWQGPAAFTSLEDEVRQVRRGVGYSEYPFLSHQLVEGRDALATLQRLCTRDVAGCPPGCSLYTLALDDNGHPVDDAVILRLAVDRFIVTVPGRKPSSLPATAGFFEIKAPKPWLCSAPGADVRIAELGVFAVVVQGPVSRNMLRPVVDFSHFGPWSVCEARVSGIPVICSRTGYSGECGIEFLVWPEYAVELWQTIAEIGLPYGARPFGIEATLVLGFEKGFLNAGDFYPGCTPLELNLERMISFSKGDFVGREAVLRRKNEGLRTRLVGLELPADAALPRPGEAVRDSRSVVGHVTNAAYCPTLERRLARAYVAIRSAEPGMRVEVGEASGSCKAVVATTYRWYDPDNLGLK